ncbi:MAG TPA: GNAT family N-acetyltransferase [Dehalococcoidia bacterium]|nr:GNAT family N-acetyltransferase [Dehalococcoidia bacterium]
MVNIQGSIKIFEITSDNIGDVNTSDTTYEIKARIVPEINNDVISYSIEEIYPAYLKTYEEDDIDHTSYIDNPDKVIFLAYINGKHAGQIVLRKNWNIFAYIEDIRVSSDYRRRGIGIALLNKAEEWATKGGMPGIMLETQDVNVPACRLYEKAGYILGGVDKKLYGATEKYAHETALFWYKVF